MESPSIHPFRITTPTPSQYIAAEKFVIEGTCVEGYEITTYLYSPLNTEFKTQCSKGTFKQEVSVPESVRSGKAILLKALVSVVTDSIREYRERNIVLGVVPSTEVLVSTPNEFLSAIGQDPAAKVRLTADLDFASIPEVTFPFTFVGFIQGSGHEIRNLTLKDTHVNFSGQWENTRFVNVRKIGNDQSTYTGILGDICDGARFHGLTLDGVTVSAGEYSGGLCGSIQNSVISSTTVQNANISGGTYVGGLTGHAIRDTLFKNVSFNGTVYTQSSFAGGITGEAIDSCMADAQAGGLIVASSYAGSLAGSFMASFPVRPGYVGQGASEGILFKVDSTRPLMSYRSIVLRSSGTATAAGNLFIGGLFGQLHNTGVQASTYKGTIRPFVPGQDPLGPPTATIKDYGCRIGGFVGDMIASRVEDSSAEGEVKGHGNIAGFTASMVNSHIYRSSAKSKLTGENYTGSSSSTSCVKNAAGFVNEIFPNGWEGNERFAYDTTRGGSTISSVTSTNSYSLPAGFVFAPKANVFEPSPSGGDSTVW